MQILKKVDTYLVKSFIGPFVAAFFIAIFVLVMQFLWSFIDEIIGKGVGTLDILELVFYNSLSIFPLALPIAVLLSSVMLFGNLSERYELSSLKSAGVSLVRVMMPVAGCAVVAALFSLYCSDTLIPASNLKFFSRLYDIRNQKPALSIEEGVFNDDFKGFTIRVGKKEPDNRSISDILIYDQTTSTRRKFNMIKATSGEMYVSDDQKFFVMKLFDGHQYQEVEGSGSSGGLPFARTNFATWVKYFDLSEFELGKTPEEYFESHHKMKSVRQLIHEIDTIDMDYDRMSRQPLYDFDGIFTNVDEQSLYGKGADSLATQTEAEVTGSTENLALEDVTENESKEVVVIDEESDEKPSDTAENTLQKSDQKLARARKSVPILRMLDTMPADATIHDILYAFPDRSRKQFASQARSKVKSIQSSNDRLGTRLSMVATSKSEHIYELHTKFSFAVICIIFLFIGAPMGAIVRKGGYGYPLLVAIIFFTLFIVLTLLFKKLSETGAVDPLVGAWAPCIVMLPVSTFLTIKALRDTKMLDVGRFFRWIASRFRKAKPVAS